MHRTLLRSVYYIEYLAAMATVPMGATVMASHGATYTPYGPASTAVYG